MNKIQKLFLVLALVMMAFSIGYKVGDSRGYTDGYNEGYRYDCKDEIAALYEQVKSQKKVTDFAQESIRNVLRENDSLKNPALAKRRYDDSVAWHKQYSEDSIKNFKSARFKNDSLSSLTGQRLRYYNDNGKFNFMNCLVIKDIDAVKECAPHKSTVKAYLDNVGSK